MGTNAPGFMTGDCTDVAILKSGDSELAIAMAGTDVKRALEETAMDQDLFEDQETDHDCLTDLQTTQMSLSHCASLDVDFNALNVRKHSTSTPFTSRPVSCTSITHFQPGKPQWTVVPHRAPSHGCHSQLGSIAALKHKLSSSDPDLRKRRHSSDAMHINFSSPVGLEELRGNLFSDMDCDKKSVDSAIMDNSQADSCYEGSGHLTSLETMASQSSSRLACDYSEDADSAFGDATTSDFSQSQAFSDCQSLISSSPSLDSLSQVHPMQDITNSHFPPSPRSGSPVQLPKPPSPNCLPVSSVTPPTFVPVSAKEIQGVLRTSLSCDVEQLIGRKMGREHIDILSELHKQDIYWLHSLLEYLEPADLSRMCCVSNKWRKIIHKDSMALKRKQTFLEKFSLKRIEKENSVLLSSKKCARQLTQAKGPLASVQAAGSIEDSAAHHQGTAATKFRKFCKEASELRCDESLTKCVRCNHPARADTVQQRARCTNSSCGHDFCSKCLTAFHGATPCHSQRAKSKVDVSVGSKKSKHRLRRL